MPSLPGSRARGPLATITSTRCSKRRAGIPVATLPTPFTCWAFGGVYIGVQLPKSAQTQKDGWTVTSGPDAKPGSWGGHCVNLVDYTSDGPTCVTWGQTMPMTWEFFDTYCDEAYAAISPDFVGDGGQTPSGFDLGQLQSDLAQITSK